MRLITKLIFIKFWKHSQHKLIFIISNKKRSFLHGKERFLFEMPSFTEGSIFYKRITKLKVYEEVCKFLFYFLTKSFKNYLTFVD